VQLHKSGRNLRKVYDCGENTGDFISLGRYGTNGKGGIKCNERKERKSLEPSLSERSFRLMFIRHKMFNEDNLTLTFTWSNHATLSFPTFHSNALRHKRLESFLYAYAHITNRTLFATSRPSLHVTPKHPSIHYRLLEREYFNPNYSTEISLFSHFFIPTWQGGYAFVLHHLTSCTVAKSRYSLRTIYVRISLSEEACKLSHFAATFFPSK